MQNYGTIDPCFHHPQIRIVPLDGVVDQRGELVWIGEGALPFSIRRVYFIRSWPHSTVRGEHAHVELEQLLVAIEGCIAVDVTHPSGVSERFVLDSPRYGLYLPGLVWRTLTSLTDRAILMVLASSEYDECDYIRDLQSFLQATWGQDKNLDAS